MIEKTLLAFVLAMFVCTVGAQSPLPPKMEGRWQNTGSGHSNKVEVELIRMESPTEAVIKVVWWPYCPWAEAKATFNEGVWKFSPQNCSKDLSISAKLRPVEGKKRLEGMYGSRDGRTIYLEWE